MAWRGTKLQSFPNSFPIGAFGGLHFRKAPGFFISGAKFNMRGNIDFVLDEHKSNFTRISNKFLQDIRLSNGARGLLAQLLSLPGDWCLYKTSLKDYNASKRTAIDSCLKELQDLGYLNIRKNDDGTFNYKVVELPEGVFTIFDMLNAQKKQCTVENQQSIVDSENEHCSKPSLNDVENQQVLTKYTNNKILTTTKSVVSENSSNEELKKYIEESYELAFTDDFYEKILQICNERGLDVKDYFDWLYQEKKDSAKKLDSYLYKSACNVNLINEYIRVRKQKEKILAYKDPEVICPSCGHKFQSIDFITRKCICGLSLDEIQAMKGGNNE